MEKLEKFAKGSREIMLDSGELLLSAGDEPQGIYYVKEGFVRMYVMSESGDELTLNIFKKGSFFPMLWAIGEMENNYYYEAMTDARLSLMSEREFVEMIKDDNELLFDFARRISVGLAGTVGRMGQLFMGSARSRVCLSILVCARRFGKMRKDGSVEIELPLSHQDVAALSGLTRETTSIEMKKLSEEKIICYRRKYVMVMDMKKLEKESGYDSQNA